MIPTQMFRYPIIIICFLFISFYGNGQTNYLTFIKQKAGNKYHDFEGLYLHYPIFKFENARLSDSINKTFKKQVATLYEEKPILPVRKLLKIAAKNGLVEMNFYEVRNDDKIFSFYMGMEGITAYSTYWEDTYTFDKKTGKRLTLDNLVKDDKREEFISLIKQVQRDTINAYRKQVQLDTKNGELDSLDLVTIEEYIKDDCWENFSVENFKFYKDSIEVIINCGFPHVMLAASPSANVIIPIKQLKAFLKPEYID